MKKKLLAVLLLTMLVSVVGCGKVEETIEPTVEAVVETTVEKTIEESIVEETTVEEMAVEETTEEVVEDPTSESNSTAQIIKLLEAYSSILTTEDDFLIQMVQDNFETFSCKFDTKVGLFADGTSCKKLYTVFSIGIEYYENHMAGNEPWDTVTWMSGQACEEDVLLMNFDNAESIPEGYETKLFGAIYLCPYLNNQTSIKLTNRIETDEYKFIKGEVSAYTYDLILSGNEDTGFKAIYDSEGNLLTISCPDDFELEYFSFDNSIWKEY